MTAPMWTRPAKRPRQAIYPLLGSLIGFLSSFGLLLLRCLDRPEPLSLLVLERELSAERLTYIYSAASTLLVFVGLGFVIGRRSDALQAASLTDPLTGLWNRRYFETRLSEELSRIARMEGTVAILLIDLDRLKQINDRYGHGMGDRALRRVGEGLRETCRAMDIVARVGGDEFAVLLPESQVDQAMELAERVRLSIERIEAPEGLKTTVSIGVSDLARAPVKSVEGLFSSADRALYSAKTRGRNCVAAAP